MSDSDDMYDLPQLKLAKSSYPKEKKIVLNPSVTLAQRQKEADIDNKIAELTKDTESLPYKHLSNNNDSSSIEAFVQKLKQPVIQEIKGHHPWRTTFLPNEFCCLFSQDTLNIQDFLPVANNLCEMSRQELHECICRHQLKRHFSSGAVLYSLCHYLFLLMSVHRDGRTLYACSSTLHYIKRHWYPSLDIIFTVFINWGISSELLELDVCDREAVRIFPLSKQASPRSPRFEDDNIEMVLELIHSVAPALAENSDEDKMNKLLQVLVLSALDEGFKSSVLQPCFSRCIGQLVNGIPESQWNEKRVWTICRMLLRDGLEHFHNQTVVCCSLLIMNSRAIEIAKTLVLVTLNHILGTELKTEPLDYMEKITIFDLLKYYDSINELNCYSLYIVVKLVDFWLVRANIEDNLNLKHLNFMVSWLTNLGGRIYDALESIDTTIVKELISRCLSNWRIMKVDRTKVVFVDGDALSSLSSDIKE